MKKYKKLAFLLVAICLLLTACSQGESSLEKESEKEEEKALESEVKEAEDSKLEENKSQEKETRKIKDYFSLKENTEYQYVGVGDYNAKQNIFVEYINDKIVQMKVESDGTDLIKLLELDDDEVREIYTEGEFYHIEDKTGTRSDNYSVILKGPLKVGTSWTIKNNNKRSITGIDLPLEIPYGKLKALEVTTELGDGICQLDYYTEGLGHVASIYKDGDFEVSTLLKSLSKGPKEDKIRLVYPLEDGSGLIYKDRKIKFKTNDRIEKILEEAFKSPENETLIPILRDSEEIRSLEKDRTNNIVKVDLNQAYLEDKLAMGSFMEEEMLQSMVNTLGYIYDTDKVFVSIEGKPYESGHFSLEVGDFFTTTENVTKLVD